VFLLPPPILEVYYAPSCAPCRLELPTIAEISRQDGVRIRIVIVGDKEKAMADLHATSPRLDRYAEPGRRGDAREILRRAGNPDGILPYARSVTSDGKNCVRWRGRITLAKARQMLAACKRMVISPPLH
jgi:hypothetical protein